MEVRDVPQEAKHSFCCTGLSVKKSIKKLSKPSHLLGNPHLIGEGLRLRDIWKIQRSNVNDTVDGPQRMTPFDVLLLKPAKWLVVLRHFTTMMSSLRLSNAIPLIRPEVNGQSIRFKSCHSLKSGFSGLRLFVCLFVGFNSC